MSVSVPQLHQLWQELRFHDLLLVSLFLLSILLLFVSRRRSSSAAKLNLPPSPSRLPLIGNLHQLRTPAHRSLQQLSHKYGPLMLLNLGHVPTLVVSSADMVKEMTKNHDIVISNRPTAIAAEILFYGCKDIAFGCYSNHWKQIRKVCAVELLSHKRVQEFQFVREEEVAAIVSRIHKASLSGSSINIGEIMCMMSNNIVSRCVIGKRLMEEDGISKLGELIRKLLLQFLEFSVGDLFPYLKWIDFLRGFIRRWKSTSRELDSFLDQLLEERKAVLLESNGSSEIKDFTNILLQVQKEGNLNSELTRNDIKAILADIFVAGMHTTSTVSEWFMAELVKHPNVMKKAQEEVRKVVGEKGKIDMNDINQMGYLKCVTKETLRLHPPAALLLPRQTSESIELGGYHIPAKTQVIVNGWAIQRDPSLWEKPEEFIPERFENMSSIDVINVQDFKFIPFGIGRRTCPGWIFAIAAIEYFMANLLLWFDWKLPGDAMGEDLDMSEAHGLTSFKKVPLLLVPLPYSP